MKFLLCAVLAGGLAVSAQAQSMSISHDAIPFGVRGQPLTLKAKVTGAGEPQAVTLYYALFRDAAPFRVPMKATGLGHYVGTIEASVVTGVDSFSYYIEAQDSNGAIVETPWYNVPLRKAETKPPAPAPKTVMPMPAPAGPAGPAPVIPVSAVAAKAPPPKEEGSWKKPALIAAGAAVVLGGAYAISQSGGGSDDGGGGGGGEEPEDPQGTYAGSVTTCLTQSNGVSQCESSSMSIVIDVNDVVFSDTLLSGQPLTDDLSGGSFTLSSTFSEGGTNHTVNFEGNVVNNRILGSVSGSTSAGGTYSGTFSATKQ